jgi:hypothetical protein
VLSSSRIPVWLGLVLASLTSLLPVGGLTVCLGHEVQHHGHSHQHSHGLVVAVGTDHVGCICHASGAEDAPVECDRCPHETHQCYGFAVERPDVTSADDPTRRETHDRMQSIVGHVALAPEVEVDRFAVFQFVAWLPPPNDEPRGTPWLERSTVLVL